MSSPQALADVLTEVTEPEYVRFVAHWLTHANHLNDAPTLTGNTVIDALVAAAAAHHAFTHGQPVPTWTDQPERFTEPIWHPVGPEAFFRYALAHAPVLFKRHGVLIEAASLESV